MPKITPWFVPLDFKNLTVSRKSTASLAFIFGGGTGSANRGNLISMPITNKKMILAGDFCLNRPITDMGL